MKKYILAAFAILAGTALGAVYRPLVEKSSDINDDIKRIGLRAKQRTAWDYRHTFKRGTTVIDLTGVDAVTLVYGNGNFSQTITGSVYSATGGVVQVQFTAANTDTNGVYDWDLTLSSNGNDVVIFPYGQIDLLARAASGSSGVFPTSTNAIDWTSYTWSNVPYQPVDADLATLAAPGANKVFYSDSSSNVQVLALGTTGQVLTASGGNLAPTFTTVAGSGDVTGITNAGGITVTGTSGEIGVAATLGTDVASNEIDWASMPTGLQDGDDGGTPLVVIPGTGIGIVTSGQDRTISATLGTSISDAEVDDNITASSYLPLAGGSMTGDIDAGNQGITNAGYVAAGSESYKSIDGANGDIFVSDDMEIDNDLFVSGNTDLSGTLTMGGNVDAGGNIITNYGTATADDHLIDKGQADGAYQPLEATLTDIADGTIAENLVNTANPWADNEVADTLTVGAGSTIGAVNGASITNVDHGSLAGLSDDDHTGYLLIDGTRAMSGYFNMGAGAITNLDGAGVGVVFDDDTRYGSGTINYQGAQIVSMSAPALIGAWTATNLTTAAEVYGAGWNADNTVPTKNDVYDKIEAIVGAGVADTWAASNNTWTGNNDFTGGDIDLPNDSVDQADISAGAVGWTELATLTFTNTFAIAHEAPTNCLYWLTDMAEANTLATIKAGTLGGSGVLDVITGTGATGTNYTTVVTGIVFNTTSWTNVTISGSVAVDAWLGLNVTNRTSITNLSARIRSTYTR